MVRPRLTTLGLRLIMIGRLMHRAACEAVGDGSGSLRRLWLRFLCLRPFRAGILDQFPPFECPVPQEGHRWCDHAGLLIFAESLIGLSAYVEPAQPVLSQWLGSLLLGAQNIEQTKFLNSEDAPMPSASLRDRSREQLRHSK